MVVLVDRFFEKEILWKKKNTTNTNTILNDLQNLCDEIETRTGISSDYGQHFRSKEWDLKLKA
jgi:hypothetical protein